MNEAISKSEEFPKLTQNTEIASLYSWKGVAERTEKVYQSLLNQPI